jgi:hypothetical protein
VSSSSGSRISIYNIINLTIQFKNHIEGWQYTVKLAKQYKYYENVNYNKNASEIQEILFFIMKKVTPAICPIDNN